MSALLASARARPLLAVLTLARSASALVPPQRGYRAGGDGYRGPTYNRGRGRGRGGDGGSRSYPRGGGSGGGGFRERGDFGEEAPVDAGPPTDALYGVSPVLNALSSGRRELRRLLVQDSLTTQARKDRPALAEVERLATERGLEVVVRDKGALNMMCGSRPHQGLVLEAAPLEFEPLNTLPPPAAGESPLWLALDEVTDPQNFGALIRSAFFLGAQGVLVSGKNSAPLTPTVSKASAGAMELMPIHAARNLPKTLSAAAEDGWKVVGAALEKSVEPAELDHASPTILVLGSEGHGLRTNVLRACTDLVRIPRGLAGGLPAVAPDDVEGSAAAEGADPSSAPDPALVDSLNVSVAGGILLYAFLTARRAGT